MKTLLLTAALAASVAGPALANPAQSATDSHAEAMARYEAALQTYQIAQSNWDSGQRIHMAWNAQQRGWKTTASGLQYRLVGRANKDGAQPVATDTVMVHYRGKLINGSEFDSSYSRNEPTSFPLNRVIGGWTEGVALMREGETYEFLIPPELAYGPRRMGNDIPANSALYFTVELLKVNP